MEKQILEQKLLDTCKVLDLMGFDEYSMTISENAIKVIQRMMDLDRYDDEGLFILWNEVSKIKSYIYDEKQGTEEYNLLRSWGITILEVINNSKSFNGGIL